MTTMTTATSARTKRRLTLAEYVRRRNGVPLGAPGSLRKMLRRSLGARSFAGFWRYWNPIFGYGLGRYVFIPLKRAVPTPLALLLTFLFNGLIHDLVTMAVRRSLAVFFTPWFFLLGLGVLVGQVVRMDLSGQLWSRRATVHLIYLTSCLVLALGLTGYLGA